MWYVGVVEIRLLVLPDLGFVIPWCGAQHATCPCLLLQTSRMHMVCHWRRVKHFSLLQSQLRTCHTQSWPAVLRYAAIYPLAESIHSYSCCTPSSMHYKELPCCVKDNCITIGAGCSSESIEQVCSCCTSVLKVCGRIPITTLYVFYLQVMLLEPSTGDKPLDWPVVYRGLPVSDSGPRGVSVWAINGSKAGAVMQFLGGGDKPDVVKSLLGKPGTRGFQEPIGRMPGLSCMSAEQHLPKQRR